MPDQEGVPSLQPTTAVQGHPISNTPLVVSTVLQPGSPSAPLSFPLLPEVWAPELSLWSLLLSSVSQAASQEASPQHPLARHTGPGSSLGLFRSAR